MSDLWGKAAELWETDMRAWHEEHNPGKPYENQMILRRCPHGEQNAYLKRAAKAIGLSKTDLKPHLLSNR